MKIGILSVFPPFRGGIAQFNEGMATALRSKDIEVHTFNFARQYPSLLFPGRSQFIDKESRNENQGVLDSINPFSWSKTAKVIQKAEIDVLIVPFWTGFLVPALSQVLKKLKGIQVVGLMHNGFPHDGGSFQRKMTLRFMRKCDAFVTLSEDVTRTIQPNAQMKSISTLFHPVYDQFGDRISKEEARASLNIPKEKKVLFFFGLVRPYKGLMDLIAAFSDLDDSYYLLIAGEAYEKKAPYLKALESVSEERWSWTERYLEDEELPPFFGAADLVVLPYKSASQSGVTAAAMHFLKPVVASDVGGLKEYIQNGETGYLVPANNPDALREGIKQAMNTTWDSSRLEENRSAFTWDRFATQLLESL